ncbi:hypothetical protein SAMN04490193_1735 [Pseudomonas marginalis]|nr:hypothetical protein SAMN04490193_1735 [Pseudomonas marginalis]
MKTTIILSVGFLLTFIMASYINESLIHARYLAAKECQSNPYACYRPAVTFASLR